MMLTDVGTEWYLFPQVGGNVDIVGDFSPAFQNNSLLSYDCIVYSVGLEINLQAKNASSVSDIQNNFDIVYNSGPYWVAIK